MDQDRCIIDDRDHCKCDGTNDNLKVISDTRLKTVKFYQLNVI